MINMDALSEANYADRDPQFQDPEAYDKDEWTEVLSDANEKIDEALDLLNKAIEAHETQTLKMAGTKLLEVQLMVEAEL